jgi:hypothetical protein
VQNNWLVILLNDVTGRHQVSNCYESLSGTHGRLSGKHKDQCHAPRLLVSGRTRSTSTSPCAATTRLRPHALYVDLALRRDYSSPAARALRRPRRAPRLLVSTLPVAAIYLDYAALQGASARRAARHAACRAARRRLLCLAQARRRLLCLAQARRRLLRLCRTSVCLGTSRGSSRGSSRRSSSSTPPHAGSSSTTSPPPRVRVPRHVARIATRLVAPPVVDYSASRRLVVDYFASAARPGSSERRVARRATRRRLLHLGHTSGCLGTSRGPSRGSSSTTPCAVTSSRGHTGSTSAMLCVATTCLTATLALLQYVARRLDVVFQSHRVDHSSRLVFQTSRERQSRPQQLVGINSD